MAILKVAQLGHPILRQIAQPVDISALQSSEFQHFLDDLLETMEEYDGAGLAAPQVHRSIRVVVLTLSSERGPEFLINPVITALTSEMSRTYEGCLSVEGIRGAVARPNHIRVEALDRDGSTKVLELAGFPATVAQHECDHLDGILYIDRCDPKTLAFLREYRKFGPLSDADYEDEEGLEDFDDDPATEEP